MPDHRRPFAFTHTWTLPFPPGSVYDVLADPAGYPRWWPEVRSSEELGPGRGRVLVRSLLPYTLELVLTRVEQDPQARTLSVGVGGDLEGWARWRLDADGRGGTVGRYDQVTTLTAAGLQRLVPLTRPLLRANHHHMMRSGERGLSAWLASEGPAGRPPGPR